MVPISLALETQVSQNATMGKKQQSDRHKPSRMVRIKNALATQLDKLVERNATDLTEEVNRAVRELLAREGLWPASGSQP